MADLQSVIGYVCKNYPSPNDLSKARLTKLIYLADWKMSLEGGHQITGISWLFDRFGPYVNDVVEAARSDPRFDVELTETYYGNKKEVIHLVGDFSFLVSPDEEKALKFAIESTKDLGWDSFIKLVYSTYPIVARSRYDKLDLPALAAEYKSKKIATEA